jgi:hypothetical protein
VDTLFYPDPKKSFIAFGPVGKYVNADLIFATDDQNCTGDEKSGAATFDLVTSNRST